MTPGPPRKRCGRRFAGLTLLELLAIIVITTLSAGAVLIRLGPVHDDTALRSTALALQELDARARLHAVRGKRIVLEVRNDENAVRLITNESRETISRESLPSGSSLSITIAHDESDRVVFDRTGRSRDYAVELARDGRRISWRVAGATGQVLSMAHAP